MNLKVGVGMNIDKKSYSRKVYIFFLKIILSSFIFFALFMPADNLNLKKIFFAVLIICSLPIVYKYMLKKKYSFILLMSVMYPLFFIMFSVLIFRNNLVTAFQIGHCGIYLLLFFITKERALNFPYILMRLLKIEAIFIVICGLLHYSGIMTVTTNPILQYLYYSANAIVGYGFKNTSFGVMIFLKTSPLMYLLLGYEAKKNNLLGMCITTLALFFSGTRANTLISVAILLAYLFFYKTKLRRNKIIKTIAIFVCLFIVLRLGADVIVFLQDVFVRRSGNDMLRFSYLGDLLRLYMNKPQSIFFGTGFGSSLYIALEGGYRTIVEAAFIDMLRQVGVFGMIPFLIMIFRPIKSLYKNNKWLCFSYIAYLIVASTNPLLYSSTAFLAYTFVYIFWDNKELELPVKWRVVRI